VGDLYCRSVWKHVVVYPAREDRRLHRNRPRLRERLHPAVQFSPRCADLSLLVNAAACVLYAIANRFLVNIQADVVHIC
jgi:hypothetical protein